jgi:hypothetical protein
MVAGSFVWQAATRCVQGFVDDLVHLRAKWNLHHCQTLLAPIAAQAEWLNAHQQVPHLQILRDERWQEIHQRLNSIRRLLEGIAGDARVDSLVRVQAEMALKKVAEIGAPKDSVTTTVQDAPSAFAARLHRSDHRLQPDAGSAR